MTEPKSVVLPLHHGPILLIAGANVAHKFIKPNFWQKKILKNSFLRSVRITTFFHDKLNQLIYSLWSNSTTKNGTYYLGGYYF